MLMMVKYMGWGVSSWEKNVEAYLGGQYFSPSMDDMGPKLDWMQFMHQKHFQCPACDKQNCNVQSQMTETSTHNRDADPQNALVWNFIGSELYFPSIGACIIGCGWRDALRPKYIGR